MKLKTIFKKFLAGIAIGAGAAIPGVSGAAIAMIFNVYEDIIEAVNNFRKKFSWAIHILIPILFGILISVIICIVSFSYAFKHMMFCLICVFAGFLIGSIPSIKDEIKDKSNISNKNKTVFIICGVFVIFIGVLSVIISKNVIDISSYFESLNANWWVYLVLIPVGVLASVALTVPGLSGSLILVVLGFYRPLIDSATLWGKELINGNFSNTLQLILMILSFGIGCLIGVIIVSKAMHSLLEKHHDSTIIGILGFMIGSIVVLFFNSDIFKYYEFWAGVNTGNNISPILPIYIEIPLGIIILLTCTILSYILVKKQRINK